MLYCEARCLMPTAVVDSGFKPCPTYSELTPWLMESLPFLSGRDLISDKFEILLVDDSQVEGCVAETTLTCAIDACHLRPNGHPPPTNVRAYPQWVPFRVGTTPYCLAVKQRPGRKTGAETETSDIDADCPSTGRCWLSFWHHCQFSISINRFSTGVSTSSSNSDLIRASTSVPTPEWHWKEGPRKDQTWLQA